MFKKKKIKQTKTEKAARHRLLLRKTFPPWTIHLGLEWGNEHQVLACGIDHVYDPQVLVRAQLEKI